MSEQRPTPQEVIDQIAARMQPRGYTRDPDDFFIAAGFMRDYPEPDEIVPVDWRDWTP